MRTFPPGSVTIARITRCCGRSWTTGLGWSLAKRFVTCLSLSGFLFDLIWIQMLLPKSTFWLATNLTAFWYINKLNTFCNQKPQENLTHNGESRRTYVSTKRCRIDSKLCNKANITIHDKCRQINFFQLPACAAMKNLNQNLLSKGATIPWVVCLHSGKALLALKAMFACPYHRDAKPW